MNAPEGGSEPAPAKVNLFLHVRGRRPDGYHDLETLFAFTAFGDRLRASAASDWSLAIDGPLAAALDGGAGNLVLRAARAFQQATGNSQAYAFRLEKYIPVAAGLGGGSADAAATLRLLNRLQGEPLAPEALWRIAAALGADVPACLVPRPVFASGTGNLLATAPPLAGQPILLLNPGTPLATADVFAAWNGHSRGPADAADWRRNGNDLQAAAIGLQPAVAEALAFLGRIPGAEAVRMSGSGATCLAVFEGTVPAIALPAGWWSVATTLLA